MSLSYNCHENKRGGGREVTNLYEGLTGPGHIFVGGEESLGPTDGHVRPRAAGIVLQ